MNTIILIMVPNHAYYSALSTEIETNHKSLKFKLGHRVRITKDKNIFSKGYNENLSREKFVINSVMKTNLWMYRMGIIKQGAFIKKNCC